MPIALLAVLFLVLASDAEAKCLGNSFRFRLDQEVSISRITDGACRFSVNNSRDPIYGTEIIARPKHGSASIFGRTTVVYRPHAGFKGEDSFAFRWVGLQGGSTPNAATVKVALTVN